MVLGSEEWARSMAFSAEEMGGTVAKAGDGMMGDVQSCLLS